MSWEKIKLSVMLYFLATAQLMAQKISSPEEHFGFAIGDDYKLTNYTQTEAYYKKLAQESNRLKLVDIGKTEEGRSQYMLIISSPKNLQQLGNFQRIAQKLALAEDLDDAEARQLARQGKAVVWIDGGLHSTEVVGTNQLIETVYHLLSRNDEETFHILDNVIALMVNANPDGHELVGNWYMKDSDTLKRNTNVPVLYQKYIGHDNNRDFYIANMKESWNMNRQLYLEWLPQIMYNHHQSGPPGSVLAGPPYRDPFNYVFDPLMMTGIDALGAAMYNRLNAENKPGFTRLKGSTFSTWYNGGLRTTTQYHNMIGLLTEIIGNPTPSSIPLVPDRLIPNGNTPNPVLPQSWHFRQSIDYSVSLNYAVLDYAARYKEEVLFNIYRMGKNSILKGQKDHWTLYPKYIDSIKTQYNRDKDAGLLKTQQEDLGYYGNRDNIPMKYYDAIFKNPALRDPRAYIVSANQRDFPTAVSFINALLKTGIKVNKATTSFNVGSKRYPAGSYVIKTDQAFRPHVLDMFEPQNYPNDFEYPGGPPIRPYDAAGWTLAFQMGVDFDRIFDAIDAPLQVVPIGELQTASAKEFQKSRDGYLLSAAVNNSFIVVNELLKNRIPVYRVKNAIENLPSGSFYIPAKGLDILEKNRQLYGIEIVAAIQKPAQIEEIKAGRIALFDQYGGSIPSGWVRWIMEQYHFAFQLIYPKEIDAGDLNKKYDAILFISGGIPDASGQPERRWLRQPAPEDIPEKYRSTLGNITIDKSIPQLKDFTEKGGTIVTVGSSTNLAYLFNLPVKNALVKTDDNGKEVPLTNTAYYIPGSILTTKIDGSKEANWGMTEYADIVFNNSPVFKIDPTKNEAVEVLSWFDTDKPLHSGWAWGQHHLKDGVTSFAVTIGKGKLYAFGPEITFRGQAHSTFKLLFNTLYSKQK